MEHNKILDSKPFNMAMMYYEELHELRIIKSRAFLTGEYLAFRDCLEEIFTAISFNLKPDERTKIQNDFASADKIRQQVTTTNLESDKSVFFGQYKNALKEIDILLLNLMHRYGMIFPKIHQAGLDSVYKSYGIKNGT